MDNSVDLGKLGVGAVSIITMAPYVLEGETIFGITITKEIIPIIVSKIPLLAKGLASLGATAITGTIAFVCIVESVPKIKIVIRMAKEKIPVIVEKIKALAKGEESVYIDEFVPNSKVKFIKKEASSPTVLNVPIFNLKNKIFQFSVTKDKH